MQKKVLTEQALYFGDVDMPKGFEIEEKNLTSDILESKLFQSKFKFSKTFDKLTTYVSDHINVKYNIKLINKDTCGDVYEPQEISSPLLNVNPVDLRNSADYTFLYGVHVKNCNVRIHFDDNRRKGRSWDIPLNNNQFVMFPSTNMYYLTNNQKDSLNFVQTITYEYI